MSSSQEDGHSLLDFYKGSRGFCCQHMSEKGNRPLSVTKWTKCNQDANYEIQQVHYCKDHMKMILRLKNEGFY